MMKTGNPTISIYTEITPNPETLKFVANKLLYPGKSIEITKEKNTDASPLAQELFALPFVDSVFIASNFVTISKNKLNTQWDEVSNAIKEIIKQYVESDQIIVLEDKAKDHREDVISAAGEEDVVKRIQELLDSAVKPAVEMDGGAIQLKKYEKGVVTVSLQGACSGCPSSMITLKAGIENMMKRMIPEVKEVVAE